MAERSGRSVREVTPSKPDTWPKITQALEDNDVAHLTIWDVSRGESLHIIEFDQGSKMATLIVQSDGLSYDGEGHGSGGELWVPLLPLVDVAPLDTGQQR